MAAVASPPVTPLPTVSIGLPPIPSPATDDFHLLDLFAFLNSPADSYQIPQEMEEELELEVWVEEELERERERERARMAEHRRLRQRPLKAETEARARVAEEHRQLEREMLDRRLAPALPYVKSLFLGWFEPLRDAIARDQEPGGAGVQRRKRVKHVYANYLLLLPADKVAVIVMHKMMDSSCRARMAAAASALSRPRTALGRLSSASSKSRRSFRRLVRKVGATMKVKMIQHWRRSRPNAGKVLRVCQRRKLSEAYKPVQQEIELEEWGTEAQVKLGTHLIELLLDSAFV